MRRPRAVPPPAAPAPATAPGKLLRVSDVAELLQLTPATVRRMCARREVAFLRIGSEIRFDPADVRAFLERARREAAP